MFQHQLPKPAALLAHQCIDLASATSTASLSCLEGGDVIERFETAFSDLVGAKFSLAVSSGTAALHTALLGCDIGPGDEIIVSPYGWGQTVSAVMVMGAIPVFADIDPTTGNLDAQSVKERLSSRTRAVLVTHLFGLPADMNALETFCRRNNLFLIADAAQALGATFNGQAIGAWGDIVCFSFGRGKAISTGEGGMVVTADPDLYERMILVSQHPLRGLRDIEDGHLRSSVTEFGLSYRMPRINAALGLGQIETMMAAIEVKRACGLVLKNELEDLSQLIFPGDTENATHAFHTCVLRFNERSHLAPTRADVAACLQALGVPIQPGPIHMPIHWRVPFQDGDRYGWFPRALTITTRHPTWERGSCPVAERRCEQEELAMDLNAVGDNQELMRWVKAFRQVMTG